MIRSLLKTGIWGSGLQDTLLTDLRRVISKHGNDSYPRQTIRAMRLLGKPLAFEDEEFEQLADMRYQDRLAFALLSLLFPFVDLRHQFHVDHIFPQARFTARRLKRAGVPDEKLDDFISCKDGLANLQLLHGAENFIEKRAKMPSEWLSEQFPKNRDRREYERNHLLGDVPDSMIEFGAGSTTRGENGSRKG